jgi:hypothetical protein
MEVIRVRNVQQALPETLSRLEACGIPENSRNGPVRVFPSPVTTVYGKPCERVLFWPKRDANPFFHLMEGLWMLAGRDDVAFVAGFASNMRSFSDDGRRLHGAYGYRWRFAFGRDQLAKLIKLLRANPRSRRAVLQMWDCRLDLTEKEEGASRDLPCNTQVYFSQHAGYLNMTVCCRSNDVIWGALGANAVHFSMLQEYIAAMIGLEVGVYYQVSNNHHAYVDKFNELKELIWEVPDAVSMLTRGDNQWSGHPRCPYVQGAVSPYSLVEDIKTWDRDLALFFEDPTSNGFSNPFFAQVAKPVYWAHMAWRKKEDPERYEKALEIIEQCQASDWKRACEEWLLRRKEKASA